MKTISFKQLQKTYGPGLVEVKSRKQALKDIRSTCSCTWGAGAKLGDSGWIALASPSPRSKGDIRTTFVCRASLVQPTPA